ncbi:MAG: hypothetical protein KDC44_15385, partial [Phaeodactylibacter sp.]|nr:hypothetical protein [Phaeodactylibacter sp.]
MKRKLHLLPISWAVCLACWLGATHAVHADTKLPTPQDCQLSVNLIPQHVSCNGAGDGAIVAQIFDENDPPMLTELLWSTGASGVQSIQGLVPGVYSITVTNTDECVVVESIEITEPGELGSVVLGIEHVACAGDASGAVTFTAFGGTPPFTYTTDQGVFVVNGGENLLVENILAGSYSAQVVDANGCTINSSYTVNEPPPLIADFFDVEGVLCPDDATGTAGIQVQGGTAPYAYQWSNGDTTALADSLPVGLVSVVVRDANNCLWQDHVAIVILDGEAPTVVVATDLTIYLDDQGQAILSPEAVDGGSYDNCAIESMSLDITTFDCTAQGQQTVVLTVTDQVGNAATAFAEIQVLDTLPPTLVVPNDTVLYDCSGFFEYEVLAMDNCGNVTPYFVAGLESGSSFPIDMAVVNVWGVEDDPAGNSTLDTFEVTVLNTLDGVVTMMEASCPGEAEG